MENKPRIRETIVVEGRHDECAVKAAVAAPVIVTSGYAISEQVWSMLTRACQTTGLILLTDPDSAGESIRRRLHRRFPEAKQAYLDRSNALSGRDVGIEYAAPAAVLDALMKARATVSGGEPRTEFQQSDLHRYGLVGGEGSEARRRQLGDRLGIGFANAKTFVSRLNRFGISRQEFIDHAEDILAEEQ